MKRPIACAVFVSSLLVTRVSAGASLVPCESTSYENSGDPSIFHISVDEILAVAEGSFDVPIRWRNSCEDTPHYFARPADCQNPESLLHDLNGSETVVHIDISHQGEPAFIRHATEEQPVCAERLLLPVRVSVISDDGMLNEAMDLEIGTECGTALGIGFTEPLHSIRGRLNEAGTPDTTLWLGFGFFSDRVWFDLYLEPPNSDGWTLTSDLPPFDRSPHDIGFSDAGMNPDLALPDRACPYMEISRQ